MEQRQADAIQAGRTLRELLKFKALTSSSPSLSYLLGFTEVVAFFEVRDERGLHGMPIQLVLGQSARGRVVNRSERCEPAEMAGCLFGGDGGQWDLQMSAYDVGDVMKRHALVGDSVISGAGGTLLERQPEEMGGIEPVNRWPAVESVAHIC